jgi:anti-sigma28 factor (negative regulator of flagellin synthesis)
MKITQVRSQSVERRSEKTTAEREAAGAPRPDTSTVKLSEVGKLVALLRKEGASATQMHDLSALRARVEAGTYRVDPEALAEDLLLAWAEGDEVDTAEGA